MLIRSFVSILIVASSFVLVTAQVPDAQQENTNKPPKTPVGKTGQRLRDFSFANGVDLQFLIKELARDMDINVLFDIETFRTPGRKTYIELKNVTAATALDAVLLQEKLYFEEAGPRTILVAGLAQQQGVQSLGIRILPMSEQLAHYFGVDTGVLINYLPENSPALKAGLRAGDVIVEIDGGPAYGALGIRRVIDAKNGGDVILKIVRDHKDLTINVTPTKGIESVLQD